MTDLRLDNNQLTGALPQAWSAWGQQYWQLLTVVNQEYKLAWQHAKGMGQTVLSGDCEE